MLKRFTRASEFFLKLLWVGFTLITIYFDYNLVLSLVQKKDLSRDFLARGFANQEEEYAMPGTIYADRNVLSCRDHARNHDRRIWVY